MYAPTVYVLLSTLRYPCVCARTIDRACTYVYSVGGCVRVVPPTCVYAEGVGLRWGLRAPRIALRYYSPLEGGGKQCSPYTCLVLNVCPAPASAGVRVMPGVYDV